MINEATLVMFILKEASILCVVFLHQAMIDLNV